MPGRLRSEDQAPKPAPPLTAGFAGLKGVVTKVWTPIAGMTVVADGVYCTIARRGVKSRRNRYRPTFTDGHPVELSGRLQREVPGAAA